MASGNLVPVPWVAAGWESPVQEEHSWLGVPPALASQALSCFHATHCVLSVPNASLNNNAFILESTYHQQPDPYQPRSCTHNSTTMALQAHTLTYMYPLRYIHDSSTPIHLISVRLCS